MKTQAPPRSRPARPRPARPRPARSTRPRPARSASSVRSVPSGSERTRSKPSSYVLLLSVVVVLNIVGLVMVLSASSVVALRNFGSSWYFFERQTMWAALGFLVLVVASRIDYHLWSRLKAPLILICFALLVAVLIPGVGVVVGGSSRWVGAGWLRIQPSEVMKFALVIYGADLLSRRGDRMGQWSQTLKPMMIVFFLAGFLVMRQPDMGTTLVLACITFGVLFAAGTPWRPLLGLMGTALGGAIILGLAQPYRRARLLSFTNPWAHRSDAGYQVVQSLVGLGSGHLFGVGLGASRAKWGFLPNAYTDFIFAVIGEELGLIGGLLVIALFVGLAIA
ncbi:MAG: peptidoglycan glycosyltransferase FtsW, partial [Acidimicrobiales bacterium]